MSKKAKFQKGVGEGEMCANFTLLKKFKLDFSYQRRGLAKAIWVVIPPTL